MLPTIRTTLACAALALAPACMLNPASRTAQGQLYTSGNPTYDAFFRDVHQHQVDAASWGDDKKTAHHALVGALDLTPDAPDVTIVQATHEASSKVAKQAGSVRLDVDGTTAHVVASSGTDGGALFHAIEDSAHQELERAKRLHGEGPKLDALTKTANDLEGRVKADFDKYGTAKENEVASEILATIDVIAKLRTRADGEARESEDFVADLERALETASEASAQKQVARRKKRPAADTAAASTPSPKPAPVADQSPPPAAARPAPVVPPPPKPADTGEVFTP
jgi:hypothetical protein